MAQPFRYADDIARADHILRKLSSQKMLDAAREVSAGDPYNASRAGQIADELLAQPEALKQIDQFIGDHGMELRRHLGAGAESIVWEVAPRSGGRTHVLKIRPDSESSDAFDHPSGVPGIVPYWAVSQPSRDISAGIQEMGAAFSPKQGLDMAFSQGANRLRESLLARGWHWGDGHKWNLAAMPDGTWGAIDGFIAKAHPSWTLPQYSDEEAIRMLRLTPVERAEVLGE